MSLTGKTGEDLLHEVAARYVEGMKDMDGRKPGPSSILGEKIIPQSFIISGCRWQRFYIVACLLGVSQLRPGEEGGYRVAYNSDATGCGAAMRSMCIGLR